MFSLLPWVIVSLCATRGNGGDVTPHLFQGQSYALAAFGDFNADKFTDLFVLSDDGKTVEILYAVPDDEINMFKRSGVKCSYEFQITSVVPGDFNGDFHLDLLITKVQEGMLSHAYILWGDKKDLNCSLYGPIVLHDEPLVMDYNGDMIPDLFSQSPDGNRTFWVFSEHMNFTNQTLPGGSDLPNLRFPSSHAFVDLNADTYPDLFVTSGSDKEWQFEEYHSVNGVFEHQTPYEPPSSLVHVGQSAFGDVGRNGTINHLLPACLDEHCRQSTVFLYYDDTWHDLKLNCTRGTEQWGFAYRPGRSYIDTITIRLGDYSLDGHVDFLATLENKDNPGITKVVLFEHVQCESCFLKASFVPQWDELDRYEGAVMGTFFDLNENGRLDIILVKQLPPDTQNFSLVLHQNEVKTKYFLKASVGSGICNRRSSCPNSVLHNTNQPGAYVDFYLHDHDGKQQKNAAMQLSQSAHFVLQCPYVTFGLDDVSNFIESVRVSIAQSGDGPRTRSWSQIIPNSQVIVVPSPPDKPHHWTIKLFLTPSELIVQTLLSLGSLMGLLLCIVAFLHWREKKQDRRDRMREMNRFSF